MIRFSFFFFLRPFFGFSWSFYLILPKYFAAELGMDAAAIGRAVAVQGITAVVATPVVGWLIDRYGRKRWLVMGNVMLMLTGSVDFHSWIL